MNSSIPTPEAQAELERIYSARFSGLESYRNEVWKILVRDFFSRWILPASSILDLGCGYGEFINNIQAAQKLAMDLNPATRHRVANDVQFLEQDCSQTWPLRGNSLDAVFTSNFLEHLPNKKALQATLFEAHRCLKPGGRFIALGPNIKVLGGQYWDFFDHHVPLTELSLAEALTITGYDMEHAVARFLPYTMSHGSRPPLWTLRLYLKIPRLWKIFGRQFLLIARKK